MKFIPRLNANDLKHNKFFNQWNGEYNPGFPEFAPLSVGGELTIDKGKYAGKHSKGNCTWYVWGRMAESGAYLPFPPRPFARGNAHEWGTHGEELTDRAELGSVIVFGDGGYGHVAFVERIEGNKVYVSESSYSERGNDFLFRCDRTVDQICKEWNMEVLRILKPLNNFDGAPSSNTESELKVGDSFTLKKGVVIYNDNPEPTEYTHQPTKDHPAVIVQESGEWFKIRVEVLDPTDVWVYKKDVNGKKEESKPKPSKPKHEDRTGQMLVIYPGSLQGDKDVDLLRRDGSRYPKGIGSSDGVERRYKIVETASDGFYKVIVPNADTSETYIKWRAGIGFEG